MKNVEYRQNLPKFFGVLDWNRTPITLLKEEAQSPVFEIRDCQESDSYAARWLL